MHIIGPIKRTSFFLIAFFSISFCFSAIAEGFITKEVYSFKDKSGNTVFTDRKPVKEQAYDKQLIEAASSTGNTINHYSDETSYKTNAPPLQNQIVRVIIEKGSVKKKTKKKSSLKRCKSYKKKLEHYNDKMKSGYKNSEYKKLESNRKKYRKLLFNNCETKTFDD